jgi:hypothetical protein
VQTLQTLAPTIRKVRDEDYPNKPHNFFTLLRFDFILDEHQKNWLVEVRLAAQHQPQTKLSKCV